MNDGLALCVEDFWAHASGDLLDRAVDRARRALRVGAAYVVDAVSECRARSVGEPPPDRMGPQPELAALARRVMAGGSLLINDLAGDGPDPAMAGVVPVRARAGAFLGVVLATSAGEPAGVLCVADGTPRVWHEGDLALLDELAASLATQVALRIETGARKKAESALSSVKARMLVIADTMPGLVFERRKVGHSASEYVFFGPSKSMLPGVRELTGGDTSGLSFVHPDDRDRVRDALRRTTIAETDLELTFRTVAEDGGVRWLRSQSVVRRDGDGTAVWDGLCFDVTDLMREREAAEAAHRLKDTMLIDINHELRTPLQAIIGFADFLKTETRPDVVRAHASTIRNASNALLCIVNQLLELASGDAASARKPTDVKAVAGLCQAMVAPLALEKAIGSRLVVDADVPDTILADGPKLQQVLVNLLNNAVKFTEDGSVALRVSCREGNLRFSVSDTGIGIPEDKIDLLFQRFSRVAPDADPTRGTGLGLAIAKQLVEQMNGTIGVARNAGGGTTFWFEVPVEPVPVEPAAEAPAEQPAQEVIESSGARILIADDLDLNRRLIADMLSLEGHEIDCVSDGAQAVQAVREHRYDLVLMDMIMPVMDGLAATRAIRALPSPACDVAIVALTAHSFKEQLDSCLAAGMDATITKPMSLDALTSAVRNWTRGRSKAA